MFGKQPVGMPSLATIALLFFVFVLVAARLRILEYATDPLRKLIFYGWYPKTNPPQFDTYASLLQNRSGYFKLLDDREQRLFVSRLQFIRNHKAFIGRGMEVTAEMEILASASIAQITFGLMQFDLPQLTKIEFTPDAFYSNLIQRDVKGLTGITAGGGRIIMSWKDFEEGYRVPDDKINLALHELGHALWIFHPLTRSINEHFDEWNVTALSELQKMRDGKGNGYLRDYASTCIEEFWAVSVECFFEAPVEFRKSIPELYKVTCLILNQDMASRYEAYSAKTLVDGYNTVKDTQAAKSIL